MRQQKTRDAFRHAGVCGVVMFLEIIIWSPRQGQQGTATVPNLLISKGRTVATVDELPTNLPQALSLPRVSTVPSKPQGHTAGPRYVALMIRPAPLLA